MLYTEGVIEEGWGYGRCASGMEHLWQMQTMVFEWASAMPNLPHVCAYSSPAPLEYISILSHGTKDSREHAAMGVEAKSTTTGLELFV